jgi:flagellar biosynthetic protein FlhB
MAEEDLGQERTEAPTPRWREEARKQGQIAVSADLNAGVMLLVAAIVLAVGARAIGGGLLDGVRFDLARPYTFDLDTRAVQGVFAGVFLRTVQTVGVLLVTLFLAAVLVGLIQSGFAFYPDVLSVRWDRLDPSRGAQRIFSLGAGVRAITALLKVAVMTALAYVVLRVRLGEIARAGDGTIAADVALGWAIVSRLFIGIAVALVAIGVFDYVIQRLRLERQLRMTRQEAKEELEQEEGDPQIKARIRRLQREAAQRRMFQEVPKATVVITNPTHLAIALRYDRGTMSAPKVVAMGAGYVAERIIDTARRHGVVVVENRPLTQALYRVATIDHEIPAALYQAVAETLAFVYRLRGIVPPLAA